MANQQELAARLVAEMAVSGSGDEISVADLLDDLACAGLELVEGAAATEAYSEIVQEAAKGA